MNEIKWYEIWQRPKGECKKSFEPYRQILSIAMLVERKVRYTALFTNLVRWHAGAASFPLSDVILAQLACPLSDVMF